MTHKLILTLGALLISISQLVAQQIKGQTIEQGADLALGFVNVALYQSNQKLVKGTTSDLDGYFTLEGIPQGKYLIEFSYVGFKTIKRPITLRANQPQLSLGKISMEQDSQLLEGVEVTGQKSQMRFDLDKKVFDVTQSIISEGASASEALANIPSVTVDTEGVVALRNNTNVTIWINGRPSGMTEDTRAQMLEQLPAESIETVEIITNPGSRFSAEGTAGIINIVLKKEKKAGYYGGVSINGDTQKGYGASANINYTYNKLQAFASLGYRKRAIETTGITERTTSLGDDVNILFQDTEGQFGMNGLFARAGITYELSKKNILGLSASTNFGERGFEKDLYSDYGMNDSVTQKQYRFTDDITEMKSYSVTLDYTHKFSKDSELRLAATYDRNDRTKTALYHQYQTYPTLYGRRSDQYQYSPGGKTEWDFQADYHTKLTDYLKLEAGYKGQIRFDEANQITYNDSLANQAAIIPGLTNDFNFNDQIHAAYLSLGGKVNRFSYQAGLRAEHTTYEATMKGHGEQEATTTSKSYLGFFPSAFLSYELAKNQEMQLNYTRRINRPGGRMLNPFMQLSDSSNISFGNPNLLPEYTTSVELNYIKSWESGHTFSTSLYYKHTDDQRQRVSYLVDNIIYSTFDNVTRSNRAGIELVGKNRLFGWLDLTTTVNAYYYKMDGYQYQNEFMSEAISYDDQTDFSWDARMIASIMLPWNLSLQLSGNYMSESTSPQSYTYARWWADAGVKKSFLNRKLNVSLSVRDIFSSREYKNETYGPNFTQYSTSMWGGTTLSANISYTFGNNKPKRPSGKRPEHTEEVSSPDEMMEF